ncbi:MAG: hypothetical protein NTX57_01390, partial [Armatimonadetes bacterium]|nr:hypothetical protein [Armatimonadota bacterium]
MKIISASLHAVWKCMTASNNLSSFFFRLSTECELSALTDFVISEHFSRKSDLFNSNKSFTVFQSVLLA